MLYTCLIRSWCEQLISAIDLEMIHQRFNSELGSCLHIYVNQYYG